MCKKENGFDGIAEIFLLSGTFESSKKGLFIILGRDATYFQHLTSPAHDF